MSPNFTFPSEPQVHNLLKSKNVWNPKAGGKKVGVAQAGGVGEELTGFYFLNPTLLSWTPWVPGRPLLPPQLGKKVKPACPGTEPSDSTWLTRKGWFAKKKFLQSGAVSGPLCLTDFCLFPCQGLVASGKGSRARGGGGLRGTCACD